MSSTATQTNSLVASVAGIAEQNSASIEEMSASAQEMTAQAQSVVESAATLKKIADTLVESVAKFKFEDHS